MTENGNNNVQWSSVFDQLHIALQIWRLFLVSMTMIQGHPQIYRYSSKINQIHCHWMKMMIGQFGIAWHFLSFFSCFLLHFFFSSFFVFFYFLFLSVFFYFFLFLKFGPFLSSVFIFAVFFYLFPSFHIFSFILVYLFLFLRLSKKPIECRN